MTPQEEHLKMMYDKLIEQAKQPFMPLILSEDFGNQKMTPIVKTKLLGRTWFQNVFVKNFKK